MKDVFDPELRKRVMSSIKSKNSRAELLVFSYLRKNKVYFQRHYSRVPGKPDIALPRKRKAVFIDGDFWHGRNYKHRLKDRPGDDQWILKIERNIERDNSQMEQLEKLSWEVMRVWESDINRKRTQQKELERIKNFLIDSK